ncbi:autotransporter outer membrane beta-barrel domain-containing protein, partial [bacterium]|nr:autotransporter outer membrane beta-barrel domain-containing protein [bacterium]
DMLSRMAFEDLSMLREVSLDMNNHLFEKEGAFAFGESISPSSYDNNIGSVGRYSLNGYNNGKISFGLGVSITDVHTNDGKNDNRRFDRNFMMSAPIGYKTHGFELITAPKMGYADGSYDRDGFNNMTYDGKVQKRMFALMNEARYPVKFGGIKLIPSAEFNVIGYNIKGHEDDKEYSLRIKSQNHYSVEAGFGLMAEKEFKPFKNHKFNVNGGVAVYHEFANPYELDVAMNGMSGTYRLQDEKRSDNRAVVRFGFDYELKDNVDVSASWLTNIDREYRTDASIDMKYHF